MPFVARSEHIAIRARARNKRIPLNNVIASSYIRFTSGATLGKHLDSCRMVLLHVFTFCW